MIKTDKTSLTYKSFKNDSSILFRQIIDIAIENSSLEFDYLKESYNCFSLISLDIKNCKIVLPDQESESYTMTTNWNRNSITIGYIDDFSFTITEADDEKLKIKADKEKFKAEVYLKLLNPDPENNTPFGFDLESDFYRMISKGFRSNKKQELFEVSLEDCFLRYSFLFWISDSKVSDNHPLLKYYFDLFLKQLEMMDFNNFPIDYTTKNLLQLSKNYLSKDERAFLQEKIIKSCLEKLEKNNFDKEDINPLEVLSNLFCEIYREIDGIDAKRFFELVKIEKVNFNFIYKTSEFMKENDFIEFLKLIKSGIIKFDNSDSFKLFISKNSYGSINEIRNEINFIFKVINRISSTKKKVNLLICISSQFEEFELSIIEDLLEPIYKLRSKKLIKLEKV